MKTTYKKPLRIKEQTDYLEANKKVVFYDVSKEEAENILYQNNYINVISPYKHLFAKKDKSGNALRNSDGHYVYERKTDFQEYKNAYSDEKNKYPSIFKNIMKFESTMNAIVSYEVIHYYNIVDEEAFRKFVERLKESVEQLRFKHKYSNKNINRMIVGFNRFEEEMRKYDDIYIFMDRLMLFDLISIFRCCEQELKTKIFKQLVKNGATLKYNTFESFDEFLKRLPSIRNCICHFNSLEILINYWDIKNKQLRTSSDKKVYMKIINKLSMQ